MSESKSKSRLLVAKLDSNVKVVSEDTSYSEAVKWLPLSSYAFNIATGGGIPEGRLIEFAGEFSSGKSLVAYDAIKRCQQAGGLAAMVDAEMTFDKEFAEKIGIDTEELVIYPPELKGKTDDAKKKEEIRLRSVEKISGFLEDVVMKVREFVPKPLPVILVVDSITAMTTLKQAEADMDDAARDMTKAQALGIMYTRLVGICKKESVSIIFVNQMRERIDTGPGAQYRDKEKSTGGKGLEFFSSLRVKFSKANYSDGDKGIKGGTVEDLNGIKVGQITRIEVIKNKLYPPFNKGEIRIDFDRFERKFGLDPYFGMVTFLKNERVFVQSGSWFSYKDTKIGNGVTATEKTLKDNPELLETIFKDLNITFHEVSGI